MHFSNCEWTTFISQELEVPFECSTRHVITKTIENLRHEQFSESSNNDHFPNTSFHLVKDIDRGCLQRIQCILSCTGSGTTNALSSLIMILTIEYLSCLFCVSGPLFITTILHLCLLKRVRYTSVELILCVCVYMPSICTRKYI